MYLATAVSEPSPITKNAPFHAEYFSSLFKITNIGMQMECIITIRNSLFISFHVCDVQSSKSNKTILSQRGILPLNSSVWYKYYHTITISVKVARWSNFSNVIICHLGVCKTRWTILKSRKRKKNEIDDQYPQQTPPIFEIAVCCCWCFAVVVHFIWIAAVIFSWLPT